MKRSILLATILLGAAGCASQTDSAGFNEAPAAVPGPTGESVLHAAAATESVKTLARVVTPQKLLGFHSTSEVSSASMADPLPMFMVGLNDLRAYREGDDPRRLLINEGSFMYPVTVGGDVRSSVIVRKVNGDWKATQFGRASLAKFAHEGRTRVAAGRGVGVSGVSLVEIPTLSARLLEHEEKGVPMLTALLDVPGTDLRAGATLSAADVFAKLQPVAARIDGKLPN